MQYFVIDLTNVLVHVPKIIYNLIKLYFNICFPMTINMQNVEFGVDFQEFGFVCR